jgi:hypothetical protein
MNKQFLPNLLEDFGSHAGRNCLGPFESVKERPNRIMILLQELKNVHG